MTSFNTTHIASQTITPSTPQNIEPEPEPKNKDSCLKVFLIVLGVLFAVAVIIAVIVYYFFLRPHIVLSSALAKTITSKNFSFENQITQGIDPNIPYIVISGDYDGVSTLVSVDFTIEAPGKEMKQEITIDSINTPGSLYYTFKHSRSLQNLNQFLTDNPGLQDFRGFQIIQPVLFGNSWIRVQNFNIEEELPTATELTTIFTLASSTISINSFDDSYMYNGEKYKRVVFGIDKKYLYDYVNSSNANSYDFTNEDKSQLLYIIHNTDGWDKNLIEVLVNKEGYIARVVFNMPQLNNQVKETSLNDLIEGEQSLTNYIIQVLTNYTNKQENVGKKSQIAVVDLQYSKNIVIEIPSSENVVDLESYSLEDRSLAMFTILSIMLNQGIGTSSFDQSNEFTTKSYETKLLFDQGKYEEMLNSANTLLILAVSDEEKAIAHYWTGLAYFKLNNLRLSEENLRKAIELNNQYATPYVTLAAISYQNGNYQEGLDYSLRCAKLAPEYAWCYNNIGIGYYYTGNKELGIQNVQKAVSLDPLSFVFNDNLNRMKNSQ